ncbi:hypothetical protein EYZ11_009807 [Aspergillus tanneri]|uniref:Uncharacterized protein n=1 Tax=Aspergillus tanneri TaxID=1220188 RepID=A0A4S3J765_9EURO|nr:uncharacterized protein ATNIH1004_006001 [Aspergillus tanneri]KAA8647309.1 hypothetical protein ATNIH1004_006001 [Aspergillus tanneri]THC90740.1 hypothetical protein EYZ11_009807 [Aspergillus tanneri]
MVINHDKNYTMSQADPLSWTLLFKKHKTTVLLMLPPSKTITSAKLTLLSALNSRGLTEINGDKIPEDPSEIEFGVAVDKNDLEKGWTKLELDVPQFSDDETPKRGAGKKKAASPLTLQTAELRNGQPIAFRFRKHKEIEDEDEIDLELEEPGWDVVLPSLDDEEDEAN